MENNPLNRFLLIDHETILTTDGDGSNPRSRSSMRVVDEATVSRRIDMADCYEEPFKILYLEDDGSLTPVTTSGPDWKVDEDDENIVRGYGELIAGGKVVGHIQFSDH